MKRFIAIFLAGMGFWLSFPKGSDAQWLRAYQFISREMSDFNCLVASGSNLYAGTGVRGCYKNDGGMVLLSANNGESWNRLNSKGWPDPRKNCLSDVYDIAVNGSNLFAGTDKGVFLSTDNGASWTAVNTGLPSKCYINCLAAIGPNLFAGVWEGVFLSKDDGKTWAPANAGLPRDPQIRCLATSGPNLFAGTVLQGVFLSTDNGASWRAVNTGLPEKAQIHFLTTSGPNLFAGGVFQGIFLSTDNGASWRKIHTRLESITTVFTCIAISGSNVFLGTLEDGVFRSTDNGQSWTTIQAGWPHGNVRVEQLAVKGDQLFAGVYNKTEIRNEIWRLPLAESSGAKETFQTYYENGQRAYANGDFKNAVIYYSQAIELDPESDDALFWRAWSYVDLGGEANYDSALVDVNRMFTLSPAKKRGFLLRGEIYRNLANFSLKKKNRKEADDYLTKALADYQIFQAENPDNEFVEIRIAHACFAKGDLDKALTGYAKRLSKKPQDDEGAAWVKEVFKACSDQKRECDCGNNKEICHLAGEYYLDDRHPPDYDLAVKYFSKALDLGLKEWSVYFDRFRAYQSKGAFAQALADANMVVKLRPDYGFAYECRAELYEKTGDWDKAIDDYGKAIKLIRKTSIFNEFEAGKLADIYVSQAGVFKKKKDWNKAIENYKNVIEMLLPGRGKAEILYKLGMVYQMKGDNRNAEKYFQQAEEMDPGIKKRIEGSNKPSSETAGAEKGLPQAAPRDAEEYYRLGEALAAANRYQEAIEAYKQAITLKPDYVKAYNNLGSAYDNLYHYQEASEAYKQAIKLEPDLAIAHHNLGIVYHKLGRYPEAIEAFKQAIKLKSDFASAYNGLGSAYNKAGRYQEASQAYKQAIKLQPDLALAYYNLGVVSYKLGRYQEAMEAYQQAIKLEPDDMDSYNNLGFAYLKLGRHQEAIRICLQAIKLKPDYANAHYTLGIAYLAIGDQARALDEYNILKTLKSEWANELLNLINK